MTDVAFPTEREIIEATQLYRTEINKRMDTRHPSASPSIESMTVTLRDLFKKMAERGALSARSATLPPSENLTVQALHTGAHPSATALPKVPECCYGGKLNVLCVRQCVHAKDHLWPIIDALQSATPSANVPPNPNAHLLAVQVLGSYTASNVPFDTLDINAQRALKLALEVLRLHAADSHGAEGKP